MKDFWKAAYSTKSSRDVGTFYHLRNVLGMSNVEADVTKCMNHAREFCEIILNGYVVGIALGAMGTDVMDQLPPNYPEAEDEQLILKENVIDKIVQLASHPANVDYVTTGP